MDDTVDLFSNLLAERSARIRALLQQHAYDEARQMATESLALAENQLGETHPTTATILRDAARAFYECDDLKQAFAHVARALAIKLASSEEEPSGTQEDSWLVAEICVAAEDRDEVDLNPVSSLLEYLPLGDPRALSILGEILALYQIRKLGVTELPDLGDEED